MGEGKIFVGQLDAKLVALAQRTGAVVWSVQAEAWQEGFSITSAPLYYDGMVVTGFNGGEMGTRGRLNAYDAKTGKLRWVFYTVPAPGEFGHETWPQDNDSWKHGGVRAGDNFFTVSIVAIEAKTGKYRVTSWKC